MTFNSIIYEKSFSVANTNGGATIMSEWAGAPCQTAGSGCMEMTAEKCHGAIGPPIGSVGHFPCHTINGQSPTQADIGTEIRLTQAPSPASGNYPNTYVGKILTVTTPQANNAANYNPNTHDLTPEPCPGTGTTGCDNTDFDVTASCADTHLMNSPLGGIGGANSWTTWLTAQMNAFNGNAGCNQFAAIQNWTLAQIQPTANCPALPALSQFGQYGGENNQGNCHPEIAVKRKSVPFKWKDLIDPKNKKLGLIDLGNHVLIAGIVLIGIFIISNA